MQGVSKLGSNTLTLSGTNSYTGATTVSSGTLSVADLENGGVNSSIGASSNLPANLVLSGNTGTQNTAGAGATLLYTGPSTTIDRGITLTGTVQDTISVNSGTLTIAGQVVSPSTADRFFKMGAGTLVFTNTVGTNTFTLGNQKTVADNGVLTVGATGQVNVFGGDLAVGNQLATVGAAPVLNIIGGTNTVGGAGLGVGNSDPNSGQLLTINLSGGVVNTPGVYFRSLLHRHEPTY